MTRRGRDSPGRGALPAGSGGRFALRNGGLPGVTRPPPRDSFEG